MLGRTGHLFIHSTCGQTNKDLFIDKGMTSIASIYELDLKYLCLFIFEHILYRETYNLCISGNI